MDPREGACVPDGATVRRSLRTALAGLAAGATHINSWRTSADLKNAADRCVVMPNNVSIDAYGLVTSASSRS
jgi:hypothetical protein